MNKGYKLPGKIINTLGHFDNIITWYDPETAIDGRVLVHCMLKADEALIDLMTEHKFGLLCVYCKPETILFQNLLKSAHSVLFLKGRVRFEDVKHNTIIPSNAPLGTAIFSFTTSETFVLQKSGLKGKIVYLSNPSVLR